MSRRFKRAALLFLLGIGLAGGFAYYKITDSLRPLDKGPAQLIRYDAKMSLTAALKDLAKRGIIRNATATDLYAHYKKISAQVNEGTYSLAPGMTADEVFRALRSPVFVKVTVPEYYWIARTAQVMERHNVCPAKDFVSLTQKPAQFAKAVGFPLPAKSLEGYLFPDTYKMEPMSGAKAAITQQLDAFQKKVWEGLGHPKNLQKAVIVASLVEREAKLDTERPVIAGVIENRLAKGMPLEIDATVLYAEQHWHNPTHADIVNTVSPYNTYKNKGLPPTPICSPGLLSIKAALHPAKHNYLYYVAMPDGHSLFAATLPEHNANINKRHAAMRAAR